MNLERIIGYGFARVSAGVFAYAFIILCLHNLDGNNYSVFSSSYAAVQIISTAVFGPLFVSIPIVAGRLPKEAIDSFKAELFSLFWVLSLIMVIGSIVWQAQAPTENFRQIAIYIVIAAMGGSMCEIAAALANSQHALRAYLAATTFRFMVTIAVFLILGFIMPYDTRQALLAMALACLGLFVFKTDLKLFTGITVLFNPPNYMVEILKVGAPALLAFGSFQLTSALCRLIIAGQAGVAEAAVIGAATDVLIGPLFMVLQILNLALGPGLFKAENQERETLHANAAELLGAQLVLLVIVAVVVTNCGDAISQIILDRKFGPGQDKVFVAIGLAILCGIACNGLAAVAIAARQLSWAAVYAVIIIAFGAIIAFCFAHDVACFAMTYALMWAGMTLLGAAGLYVATGACFGARDFKIALVSGGVMQVFFRCVDHVLPDVAIIPILSIAALVASLTLYFCNFIQMRSTINSWILSSVSQRRLK